MTRDDNTNEARPSEFGSQSRRTFLRGAALATAGMTWQWGRGAQGEEASELKPIAGFKGRGEAYFPVHAVTQPPKHHFFGYYDKCPWNSTGRYLLAMEIGFIGRQPNPDEPFTVGMVDLEQSNRYIPLDTTLAWSWQQGTMLQWLGSAPDREVIYNVLRNDGSVGSVVLDVESKIKRPLPLPIYAVSSDGTQAVTLDFARLHRLRPGYGYIAAREMNADEPAPSDVGIWWMDLKTGANRLILSLDQLSKIEPNQSMKDAPGHWVNHLQFNPSGSRFVFLNRWTVGKSWKTRLFTAKPDGTDVQLHIDTGMVSHFDWLDDKTILAWTQDEHHVMSFYLLDIETNKMTPFAEDLVTRDGHCSFSPNRKWVLNDTYPDSDQMQSLMLLTADGKKKVDLGKFYLPPELTRKPYRCDLHPRWNRDGTQVCIDSAHEGTRQVYVIDVSSIVS